MKPAEIPMEPGEVYRMSPPDTIRHVPIPPCIPLLGFERAHRFMARFSVKESVNPAAQAITSRITYVHDAEALRRVAAEVLRDSKYEGDVCTRCGETVHPLHRMYEVVVPKEGM